VTADVRDDRADHQQHQTDCSQRHQNRREVERAGQDQAHRGQDLEGASHQEPVARIRFCVVESLLSVITGEVGVRKTVALRAATSQLDQAAHHVVYLANPSVGTRGLYSTIGRALG